MKRMKSKTVRNKVVLHFPKDLIDQPIIYRLAREYDLMFNILQARITPREEGVLVIELGGTRENYESGIEYLKRHGVQVQPLSADVSWNEERCVHCGLCLAVCPTGALHIPDRKTMKIQFDVSKCTGCRLCVPVCPQKAMDVTW